MTTIYKIFNACFASTAFTNFQVFASDLLRASIKSDNWIYGDISRCLVVFKSLQ